MLTVDLQAQHSRHLLPQSTKILSSDSLVLVIFFLVSLAFIMIAAGDGDPPRPPSRLRRVSGNIGRNAPTTSASAPQRPPSRNGDFSGGGGGIIPAQGRNTPTPGARPPLQRPPSRNGDPHRQSLRQIATETMAALNNGYVDEPVLHRNAFCRHRIGSQIRETERHTIFYPDNSAELRRWKAPPPAFLRDAKQAKLQFVSFSTLKGARYLHSITAPSHPSLTQAPMGILNFASATQPGGGFLNGAAAQEESIARSSSLYSSLNSPTAAAFYNSHKRDDKGGFYSHAMIFSPSVMLFREDDGTWMKPIKVQVITSPAVNAKVARQRHQRPSDGRRNGGRVGDDDGGDRALEARIREVMTERMARILALFELQGVRNIVLGSFGTGVYQNDVRMVAEIWRWLLHGRNARFARSFDHVLFAIPDTRTLEKFRSGFGPLRGVM